MLSALEASLPGWAEMLLAPDGLSIISHSCSIPFLALFFSPFPVSLVLTHRKEELEGALLSGGGSKPKGLLVRLDLNLRLYAFWMQ